MLSVSEAVKQRRTVRGFKSDPVPNAIIREILEIARYAPSNCNTQPWHLTLVSGKLRQQLEQALLDHIASGSPPVPEFKPGDADLSGVYRERQIDCALRYLCGISFGYEDVGAKINGVTMERAPLSATVTMVC